MNRAGAQEVFLPALQPAELWQTSGRWEVYGPELMRLKDRHERDFCLGPTHEEVITSLVAGEVRSYRQLPLNLYQIQTKFRDEIRPRFGVMRGREFSMKDAYSFDRDEAGAEESYRKMYAAYNAVFRRCGLDFVPVEADSGPIGGSFSHEFMVLADTGEDAVMSCAGCGYAANLEKAELPHPPKSPEPVRMERLVKVATPGMKTIEEVSSFLQVNPAALVKTLIYTTEKGLVAVLIRGDHQLNEVKLKNLLRVRILQPAAAEDILKVTGAPVGFAGPVGLKGARLLLDRHVAVMADMITGANEGDSHFTGVNAGRDFAFEATADLKQAEEGDPCPRCTGKLALTRGIEVGHVFKLGNKYSKSLGARYLDENGQEKECIMGCYGIGIGRTVAASIEQNHDEHGIIWPPALAPFHAVLLTLKTDDAKVMEVSAHLYAVLREKGWDVLWDDRDERPGVKFMDADLIGMPLRVTVGPRALKEGRVETKIRKTGEEKAFNVGDAPDAIDRLLRFPAGESSA